MTVRELPTAALVACVLLSSVVPPCTRDAGGCPCPRARAQRGASMFMQRQSGVSERPSGRPCAHWPQPCPCCQSPLPPGLLLFSGTCPLSLRPPNPEPPSAPGREGWRGTCGSGQVPGGHQARLPSVQACAGGQPSPLRTTPPSTPVQASRRARGPDSGLRGRCSAGKAWA